MALDNCGSYLVTGSKDCTCIVWSLTGNHQHQTGNPQQQHLHTNTQFQINTYNSYTPRPWTTLYGHDNNITSVAIYTELDMVVSGSMVIYQ